MLPEELRRKVRLIEISTRKVVDHMMSGEYKSHFKGHGVQFSEHRLYVPGDDVRHIDWKVSARSRDPLIKKYEEERELTVFLVVDVSGSNRFGSTRKLKSEVSAEIAGMLAYAASHAGDKVGALLFAGKNELIVPPRKSRQHVLRIIRDVMSFKPESRGTNLKDALDATGRIMKHGGVVFVLSDFLATGYEVSLTRLARRHDVVAISIGDPRERSIPSVGSIFLEDPETGQARLVDTSAYAFRQWIVDERKRVDSARDQVFKSGRLEHMMVQTSDDYVNAVVRFFRARARRKK